MRASRRPIFPKDTLVLVCDGAKALFFENAGDEKAPNLKPLSVQVEPHPPARDMGRDRPTRVYDSHDGSRSGSDQTDRHAEAEVAFLSETARELDRIAEERKSTRIVIVAPPKALGVLRSTGKANRDRIVTELASDLVNHPTSEIERHIAALDRPA
ncbi:MAG: hypothetical protein CML24_09065 [Rhizobiales bacterium]|nr:hypothetical protein [Hyphomicrobiales bacterium]|tara:strand:+ start:4372 stop:4839 length:468 start_codon:yes stop_codon:yes gene_type:complete